MSEHLTPRSSVGSRGSAPPYHPHPHPQQHHIASHGNPDPLASVWIRRLHLTPNPPPPHASLAPPPCPPPHDHDAVSARSAGFGPFRWSPRPLGGAWEPAPAPAPCGGPPMMSPFFRFPPQPLPALADAGELAPVRPTIGFGGGGFPGSPSPTVLEVNPHASWLRTAAAPAGSAYPNHAVDMVPIRTSHVALERAASLLDRSRRRRRRSLDSPQPPATPGFDRRPLGAGATPSLPVAASQSQDLHVRQHSMIPQAFARRAHSSSSEHDEPFSYWNMGRFQRSTITSSISQIAVEPGNFVKKRNAESNNLLPLKFRKLSGAG